MDIDIWSEYDYKYKFEYTKDDTDFIASMEKYPVNKFYRQFNVFRIGEFGSKIVEINEKTQLPIGSILHILDDVSYPNEHSDVPRWEINPFITQESYKKYIVHIREPNLSGPILSDDKFIYRPAGLPTVFARFRSEAGNKFKYPLFFTDVPKVKESLIVVNHNPLFRIKVYGIMQYFRRMQIILASILNTCDILKEFNRQQFILIPWDNEVFDKSLFIRSRKELTKATVRKPDSFHYIFMMHLLNYMWDNEETTSYFEKLDEDVLKQITIIINYNKKYLFYNLYDIKKLNDHNRAYIKCVNQLNTLSILGRITNDVQAETAQPTLEKYGLNKEEEVKEEVSITSNIKEENNLIPNIVKSVEPKVVSTVQDEVKVEENIRNADKEVHVPVTKIYPKANITTTIPTVVKSVEKDSSKVNSIVQAYNSTKIKDISEDTSTYTEEMVKENDSLAEEYIDSQDQLTPAQKRLYKDIAKRYKKLKLGNETIEEILSSHTDTSIANSTLDKKQMGNIPDESAYSSTIFKFDREYMAKTYKQHLAGVISSFQKNGVYLIDVKEDPIVDEMSNMIQYSCQYIDLNGNKSTVKFTIPSVDREGRVKIDGVKQHLKKQRLNLPLVKISDVEISLSSNYNKTRVIRNENKAHNYFSYVDGIVNNSDKSKAIVEYGRTYINLPISYEYCSLANSYKSIRFDEYDFYFEYYKRGEYFNIKKDKLVKLENIYGTIVGQSKKDFYFVDNSNKLYAINKQSYGEDVDSPFSTMLDIFVLSLKKGEKVSKQLTEWVSIKILDKLLPVIFLLGYRYGLRNTLEYMGIKYTITENKGRVIVGENGSESFGANSDNIAGAGNVGTVIDKDWIKFRNQEDDEDDIIPGNEDIDEVNLSNERKYTPQPHDIKIKFADRTLWINRYPLQHSLVVAGLDNFDVSKYEMSEFESKDVYFQLLVDKDMSINYLKGIDDFFDLFIDNITYSILKMMHEPTNVRDLLLRCAVLLSTTDHLISSARENHRIRGYEQFVAILYNEMARQLATYRNKRGRGNKFNIPPDAVYLRILQNATMIAIDEGNPYNDLKEMTEMSYAGSGGRTSEAFVVKDRKFSDDDVGVISESTPDNAKVGMNAQLSLDPGIHNTYGVLGQKNIDDLGAGNIFSPQALLFPFSNMDDPCRINFISTQTSHVTATDQVDICRVRTGYERMAGQRVSRSMAGVASQDGKVTKIDDDAHMVEITYKDGTKDIFEYGSKTTPFAGFFADHQLELVVKLGQQVKQNDIITYNKGYFKLDPDTKQLDMSIGVMANVAFMEIDLTNEDSTSISKSLSEKLAIRPVNIRTIVLNKNSVVYDYKKIGEEVNISTDLLVFDEEAIATDEMFNADEETIKMMSELNRKTPSAKHSGTIIKMNAYSTVPISEMHPSLQKLFKECIAWKNKQSKFSEGSLQENEYPGFQLMKEGSKYLGITFDAGTVVIIYYIKQYIPNSIGDKITVASQLKGTNAVAFTHPIYTESNKEIDMLFSMCACDRRVCTSYLKIGMLSLLCEKIEKDAIDIYFK